MDAYLSTCSYTVEECLCNEEDVTTDNGTGYYPAKSKQTPILLQQIQEEDLKLLLMLRLIVVSANHIDIKIQWRCIDIYPDPEYIKLKSN